MDSKKWNGREDDRQERVLPDDRQERVLTDDRQERVLTNDRQERVVPEVPDSEFLEVSRGRRRTRTQGPRARRGRLFRQLEVPSFLELSGRVIVDNGLDLSGIPTPAENLKHESQFLN